MNGAFAFLLAVALLACPVARSQTAGPNPLPVGTTIAAMLNKKVDVRNSKVGDEVVAQTTTPVKEHGEVIIPKGSKILGRITEAKARTNADSNSVLAIAFDRVVLKKVGELPMRLTIQTLAPDVSSKLYIPPVASAKPSQNRSGIDPMNRPSTMGANSDPNAGTPGRPESPVNPAYEQSGDRTANGALTPQCHGVLGIDGLVLALEPKYPEKGTLIFSQTKNIRLDGRTQLMLRIADN